MGNEPPTNDPMNIWQSQPTEPSKMTLEEIRRKAQELQTKTRREFLANAAMSLALIAFCAWSFAKSNSGVQRTGFALAIAWSVIAQHPGYRRMRSATLAGDAALASSLEFYRRELERRRDQFRQPWRWFLGPILIAIGSFLLPAVMGVIRNPDLFPNMVPFLVLFSVWIAIFFTKTNREVRRLQREIDELNALERENTPGT